MAENPYQPPEHYVPLRKPLIPITAYFMVGLLFVLGAALIWSGAVLGSARQVVSGIGLGGIGIVGSYFILANWLKSERDVRP